MWTYAEIPGKARSPRYVANTTRSFTELKARTGTAVAREGQRLVIGPWDHLNSTGIYPDRQ